MANHITNSQLQTLLAITTSALTVGQFQQIADALDRTEYVHVTDGNVAGTSDPTLAAVFPSAGNNP